MGRCPGVSALIEEYLRFRGIRYFRGHQDDEYLFLVDGLAGKMHVRLAAAGPEVRITITPGRYYPAGDRDRLACLVARWAAGGPAEAVLHPSSDPALVGIAARARIRPDGVPSLADFVDRAIARAVDLFADLQHPAA